MEQFALLLNRLTPEGSNHFAVLLNQAKPAEAKQLGRWLRSASPGQIEQAALLVNQGRRADFLALTGLDKAAREMSLGAAGLVLVLLRLLQFAGELGDTSNLLLWFISSIGILASLVGLVLSIVAIFKNSGRGLGILGVVLWGALALLFMVL